MIGRLLSSVVRVVNTPARAFEKLIDEDSGRGDPDNILSKPLECIASALDELDD